MNDYQLRNRFKEGLCELLIDIEYVITQGNPNPYARKCADVLHEHNTRVFFLDRLLTILGWSLGPKGNVTEEARIKAETTRFMDYVGLNEDTNAPLMIFEAKAWGKPFVTARKPDDRRINEELIAAAVCHVLDGNTEDSSPVINLWHEYIKQIIGYVQTMKENNTHDTPCAVLSSGEWTVVFTNPTLTFITGKVSSRDIHIFNLETYQSDADSLFDLLHHSLLAKEIPYPLRVTQINEYIRIDSFDSVYYGVHVHYEVTGSRFHGPKPKILIYPILLLQRRDGIFAIVSNAGENFPMDYMKNSNENINDLSGHLKSVSSCLDELYKSCGDELNLKLEISPLNKFPGFPTKSLAPQSPKLVVKQIKNSYNEWFVITGKEKHYLFNNPRIKSCRFHSWAECRAENKAIGISAINTRSINPRIIFIDSENHHCAHQTVFDRKKAKCYLLEIDERICCQTCTFLHDCWSQDELEKFPCGK